MFTEYLSGALWQTVLPGISMCAVCGFPDAGFPLSLPLKLEEGTMEIFVCRSGCIRLHRKAQPPIQVLKQEFLILSHCRELTQAVLTEPLDGFCLSLRLSAVAGSFDAVWKILGLPELGSRLREQLDACSGCCRIHSTAWSRSMFSVLSCLPPAEQGRYCVMKSAELLYLLFTKNSLVESSAVISPGWGYLAHTVSAMRSYMETHLDEKLTISAMSSRFHISPTAFKSCFRSLYGQPVHSWLLQTRLEQAAALLAGSSMTVLQAAQDVGYESVGQFHVAFKRHFGMTPNQYRKMSHSE